MSSNMTDDFLPGEAFDPLLECLIIFTKRYQRSCSRQVLTAGLPLENHCLTPSLFVRAATRAGLNSRIVKRPLRKVSALVLPAILLLKDNHACILNKWIDKNTVSLTFAESGSTEVSKTVDELAELYTGYAIFVYPIPYINEPARERVANKESWFWGTLWRFRRSYAEVLLAALLINIFTLMSPLFVMNVYDRVVPNNVMTTLWVLATGIFIIYGFDLLLRTLRGYLIDVCGKKADILMASRLFQQVMGMELASKPASIGAFSNTIREFETVRDFFTSATLTSLIDLPFIFLFLFLIYYLGGPIVFIPLLTIPTVLIVAWSLEKPLQNVVREALRTASQKNAVLVESMSGLEAIKSMGSEGLLQQKWESLVAANARLSLKSRFLSAIVINFTNYSQQVVSIGVVVLGVYQIAEGALTLGGLIACTILAGRCLTPLGPMANLITRYQQAKHALQELNILMETPQDRPAEKQFLHRPHLDGNIEFEHVSFHYPNQQSNALNDISFKIKAGEKIGIVGRIGSGKSTLHKLLLGLYRPTSGSILLDGANILQIDPIDLRHNIGYVPQDCLLFTGNIRENIIMTKPWADDKAVLEIAKITGVDRFISQHPEGYDLHVGERGETLSGGQRQSVTIARALLPNSPIILMDEPTNAMDERTESELITGLTPFLKDKTVIVVTHKPSLLTLVDRIIVFEGGRIVFDGPKSSLIKTAQQPDNSKK